MHRHATADFVRLALLAGLACACLAAAVPSAADQPDEAPTTPADAVPDDAVLEAEGAVIREIRFDRHNVFDLSNPEENNWLYRLANRWHIMTRESVLLAQLLFRRGDTYSRRVLDESERILRKNEYLYDAKIVPVSYEDGQVDVIVWTRDVWTLMPGFSISRKGGENKLRVTLSEKNLAGWGSMLKLSYEDNVDRESTSFEFFDRNLRKSWTSVYAQLADNSDGDKQQLRVIRPFYALDSRWAAGIELLNDDFEQRFFDLGNEAAEYRQETERYVAYAGRSKGLVDGWVRRWTAGAVYDERSFSEAAEPTLPALVPENRKFIYPFVGFELLEDQYEKASNRDQIERTEDFLLGTRLTATLGYASEDWGSTADSVLYSATYGKGFGSMDHRALLLESSLSGRFDDGDSANTMFRFDARYYRTHSNKRLFFMTLEGAWGEELDLDNLLQLGGDNGLRGYPLRYQIGSARLLFSIEERYFTDWYPFRLVRVGFAAFADVGRTWGDNPAGGESLGWLKDVGVGLRLMPTRASGRDVYHLDVAFPLDGDPSIDSVQVILESKRSF